MVTDPAPKLQLDTRSLRTPLEDAGIAGSTPLVDDHHAGTRCTHERDRVERQLVPLNPVQGADRHDVGGMVEVILSPGRGREELVVHPEMAHPRRASVSAQHRLSGER
jgi:hypothetical protein